MADSWVRRIDLRVSSSGNPSSAPDTIATIHRRATAHELFGAQSALRTPRFAAGNTCFGLALLLLFQPRERTLSSLGPAFPCELTATGGHIGGFPHASSKSGIGGRGRVDAGLREEPLLHLRRRPRLPQGLRRGVRLLQAGLLGVATHVGRLGPPRRAPDRAHRHPGFHGAPEERERGRGAGNRVVSVSGAR